MEGSQTPPAPVAEPSLAHSLLERNRKAVEAHEESERRKTEEVNRNREAARKEFEASETGQAFREIRESERIMRLPTPEALRELGCAVGDPLKGPSS